MKKINFFGLFVGGKIMWQKMWQKCGILCTKRGIRKESGGMAKKSGEVSLTSNLRNSGKKMVEHSGFEPLTLTLPVCSTFTQKHKKIAKCGRNVAITV